MRRDLKKLTANCQTCYKWIQIKSVLFERKKNPRKSKDIYKCRLQRKDERAAAGRTHGMQLSGIREK
jgi:hypothetical protein